MTPPSAAADELVRPISACPACGVPATEAASLFEVVMLGSPAQLLGCRACGLLYKSVALTEAGLARIYGSEYVHFQAGDVAGIAEVHGAKGKLGRARNLLGRRLPPRDIRVLDVGCGRGDFVAVARSLGYRAEGIDPYLPAELEGEHLHRLAPGDVAPASYDIAVLLNVAEHLVEPAPLFAAVRRLLRPDGVLLLNCPYGDSLARRVHRARWTHVALDEHLLFWTPRSMTRFLRDLGYSGRARYRISGSPFPYGLVAAAPPAPSPPDGAKAPTTAEPSAEPPLSHRVQRAIWRFARVLQRSEPASNAVRQLIHLTRTGDYLELAIGVGAR